TTAACLVRGSAVMVGILHGGGVVPAWRRGNVRGTVPRIVVAQRVRCRIVYVVVLADPVRLEHPAVGHDPGDVLRRGDVEGRVIGAGDQRRRRPDAQGGQDLGTVPFLDDDVGGGVRQRI